MTVLRPRGDDMNGDVLPAAAAGQPFSVKLWFDTDNVGFGASIQVPNSLKSLLQRLPEGAAALLDWMPDITLGEFGAAFTGKTRTFGLFAEAGIAGSADPAAKAFLATLPDAATNKTAIVVGMALTTPVDFSTVPVVGTLMSGIMLDDLAIVYAGADLPKGAFVLPPPGPASEPAFKKGLSLVLTLESGGAKQSFALSPKTTQSPMLRDAWREAATPGGVPMDWFNVQKSIGPLTIGRIGIATSADWLGLGLDAGLALSGLAIDLVGFTVAFPKDDISPRGLTISLEALSVVFASGQLLILGSLARGESGGLPSYNGSLLIQAGAWGIAAIGSFAQIQGAVSMFVFGAVQGVFGGPPAFLVTGIAAGFGYNRSLKIPEAADLCAFPLVLVATLGKAYLPDPKNIAAALGKLDAGGFVPPRLGSYWVAAGVQFSSFQMLNTFALLTVEFGNDLVIALLGVSALTLPKGPGVKPFAFAEMTLTAVLRPGEGTFKLMALLTPRSFVLDPNCRLTGGFAFYLWFGSSPHAGDFVVTLGGYNPLFVPEPWYPAVPRLGFVWTISRELRAEGGVYFALTPSAIMAGGALDLRFEAGALKAWFTAHADFIMWWKPFYFDVNIGVSIGVSYTADFGVARKTFTVELSASVNLFGPPIAGTARVKWWVISFDIAINGGGTAQPPARTLKDWGAFASSYFPAPGTATMSAASAPASPVVRPLVMGGLVAEIQDDQGDLWLVSTTGLALGTETLVPAASITVSAGNGGGEPRFDGPQVGVYPLGSVALAAPMVFTVRNAASQRAVDIGSWRYTPQLGHVPQSMWGLENSGRPALAADTMPAMLGLRGVPAPPVVSGPPPAAAAVLALSALPKRDLPLPERAPIDGATLPPDVDPFTAIADTVAQPGTAAAREAIVAALNAAGVGQGLIGGDLALLADEVRFTFQEAPMLGPLGSTGPLRVQSGRDAGAAQARHASTGTQRPRAAGRSAGATPGRGAAPRLRALFRRQEARAGRPDASWYEHSTRDGFAGPVDRMLLAGGQGVTALAPGMGAVFDVPPASALTLHGDGALPIDVVGLDSQDQIRAIAAFAGEARWALPDAVARVVVAVRRHGTAAPMTGWTAHTPLVLVAPQVLWGDGVVVRAQSPLRVPHRGTDRAGGILCGGLLAARNRTLGAGVEPGWTETITGGDAGCLGVFLQRGIGPDAAATGVEVHCTGLHGAPAVAGRMLSPKRVFFQGNEVVLVYAAPAGDGGPVRTIVRPPAGFAQSGLLACTAAPADFEAALARHAGVRASQPKMAAATEICFR